MSAVAIDTKPKTAPQPTEPYHAPCLRLSVVYFRDSVWLQSELQSVSVALPGFPLTANSVDSVEPANVLPDGSCVPVTATERGHGLLISKKVHNLHTGKRHVMRTFCPWHNVRSISYAE